MMIRKSSRIDEEICFCLSANEQLSPRARQRVRGRHAASASASEAAGVGKEQSQ